MSLMLTDDAPVHTLQQSQHGISTVPHVQAAQPLSMGMSILRKRRENTALLGVNRQQRFQEVWPPRVVSCFAKSLGGEGSPKGQGIA